MILAWRRGKHIGTDAFYASVEQRLELPIPITRQLRTPGKTCQRWGPQVARRRFHPQTVLAGQQDRIPSEIAIVALLGKLIH
jgi:hypothetical protein